MKVMECCRNCLKGLAEKTVNLSSGDGCLLSDCRRLVDESFLPGETPTGLSNRLLKLIRERTAVYDPYAALKEREFRDALTGIRKFRGSFLNNLAGMLKLSALGNSMDFFIEGGVYDLRKFSFYGDVDKIESTLYNKKEELLILGDNIGDFLFDVPLARFLKDHGKTVYYAVKEHPVQNDLSMADVEKFGFREMFSGIISTGTDEVGIRPEDMTGKVKDLWDGDGMVIAKGMGNFETLSEYGGRRVIHIMKVKCPAVSGATGKSIGTYFAGPHKGSTES
jgi:uncharacterized protein with ATP-grasp and redox domains